MKRAIYFRLVALTFIAILICVFISAFLYAVYTENQTKEWLTKLTLSTAENYKYNTDVNELSKSAGNNRVTIISPDGNVLDESDAYIPDMENHADREEVINAKSRSVYITMRTSSTIGEKFIYVSIKAADGNIIRLAYSYPGLIRNIAVQLPSIFSAISIALILSLFLAGRFTKTVIAPLEKTVDALSAQEYDKISDYRSPYYEIDKMMQALKKLLREITDSNIKLQDEREKVEYILSNMSEGFVFIDDRKNILLCNNSAREFFGCGGDTKLESIYNLTRNQIIGNAVQSALDSAQSTMFDLTLRESVIVNIYISPSKATEAEHGVTMLIVDVTAQKRLEQQKRDFFSNASHELKTPITSIIGFSEMLNNDMIEDEEKKIRTMNLIETEAKRMAELINDILAISKLESKEADTEHTDFSFDEIVREAVTAISPIKDDTAIEITMDLEDILYRADKRQIYALCANLIENAVKYNKPSGKVHISLKTDNDCVVFKVKDTGIGISPEYQARVFERFFRIDYGRDKKIGGTGLGLSIVKHIVSIYGGKISLQSKKDIGTEIIVSLPLNRRQ